MITKETSTAQWRDLSRAGWAVGLIEGIRTGFSGGFWGVSGCAPIADWESTGVDTW
tara:strand:- start:820 stop:987 length:168 start_codon:yes stop_codon:yes gene_type:complete